MNTVILPVLVPLVAGVLGVAFPSFRSRSVLAIASCGAQLFLAVSLLALTLDGGRLGLLLGGWQAPHGIVLVCDTLAALMLLLSSLTLLAATAFTLGDAREGRAHALRLPLLQFLAVGINLSFLTGDFFNLFVAFEVMLLSSYALLTLEADGKDVRHALGYVLMNVAGSTLFLCLAGFAYGTWGTLNFADLGARLSADPSRGRVVLFAGLSLAVFGLKAGLFPLYYWLPRSYPVLPAAVAGLFAGMLTKVGVYVLLRMFTTVLPGDLPEVHAAAGWLSAATMIFGVLGALSRKTIRGVLSYHILSQVGYMTLCIGLLSPLAVTACIVYVVHHIVVKGSLFLIGGAAARLEGTDTLDEMGGLWKHHAPLGILFLLQAFSLAGLPPLSGFWGKYLILVETVRQGKWWFAAAVLVAGVLTLASMLKIWLGAFWGRPRREERSPEPTSYRVSFLTIAALACVSLFVGLGFPSVLAAAETAAKSTLDRSGYAAFVAGLRGKDGR